MREDHLQDQAVDQHLGGIESVAQGIATTVEISTLDGDQGSRESLGYAFSEVDDNPERVVRNHEITRDGDTAAGVSDDHHGDPLQCGNDTHNVVQQVAGIESVARDIATAVEISTLTSVPKPQPAVIMSTLYLIQTLAPHGLIAKQMPNRAALKGDHEQHEYMRASTPRLVDDVRLMKQ